MFRTHERTRSSATGLLTLLLLLSIGPVASANNSRQEPDRPTLVGQTLEVASTELREKQRPPLSCGYRFLSTRSFLADLIFIASKGKQTLGDDVESDRVTVRHVLKCPEGVALHPHDSLNLPPKYVPKDSMLVLVFCQKDGDKGLAITEFEWVNDEAAEYLTMLSTYSDPASRFQYLLDHEENPDSYIERSVFYELTWTSDETLEQIASSIPREQVIHRARLLEPFTKSGTPAERRAFYIKLLGIIGDAGDAHLLEPLVFGPRPGAPHLPYLHSAATISYLKLAGASGAQQLIDANFTQLPEGTTNEGEGDPDQTAHRAFLAFRNLRRQKKFDQAYETASKFMLSHTSYPHTVLETGTLDRDWRWTDDAIRLYHLNKHDFIQHAALVYLEVIRRDRLEFLSRAKQHSLQSFLAKAERDDPDASEKAKKELDFR